MSFKDCVNTKDCAKIQTDIDDVKGSISGISDDVETITETTIPAIEDEIATITETTIPAIEDEIAYITETTIPAIQDDISDLDDRVSTLESGTNYNIVPASQDWNLYDNTNRILIFHGVRKSQIFLPKGQTYNSLINYCVEDYFDYATITNEIKIRSKSITELTNDKIKVSVRGISYNISGSLITPISETSTSSYTKHDDSSTFASGKVMMLTDGEIIQ